MVQLVTAVISVMGVNCILFITTKASLLLHLLIISNIILDFDICHLICPSSKLEIIEPVYETIKV